MKTATKKAGKAQGATATTAKPSAVKTAGKKAAEQSANVIETIVKREQRFLYRFQVEGDKLTPAKAKQRRQKIRRELSNFDRDIRLEKDPAKRAEAIKAFNKWYKETFILNDYSVKSLTDSRDQHQQDSYAELLKRVQDAAGKSK